MKLTILLVMVTLAAGAVIQAQEKTIKRTALPPAVQKTVAAEESKGAVVKSFATEIDGGQRLYEAALVVDGHARDISMDKRGNIVEIEDEVAMKTLPAAVQAGLRKAAGAGTIGKVETLTKKGKLVAYEADVKTGTKGSEVQVGPDGGTLAHPE